jgi:hypothetical protein
LTVASISFTGVDQTDTFGTVETDSDIIGSPSVSVSSASGELVFDVVGNKNSDYTLSVGADQTELWQEASAYEADPTVNVRGAGSTELGASSVTMSWTLSGTTPWAIIAVPLKPSGG